MRSVDTRFWSDGWVRKLNALDRYVFIYLLTNDHTNWCGVFELPISIMAFDTGVDERDLQNSILPRLEPKILYEDGWVFIKNYARYHNGGPNAEKGLKAALAALPEKIRIRTQKINEDNPLQAPPPSASASAFTYLGEIGISPEDTPEGEITSVLTDDWGDEISGRRKKSGKRVDAHILEVFRCFSPRYPKVWEVNLTQRGAADRLSKRGLDQVNKALAFYRENKTEPFCPNVNDPWKLDNKWADLFEFKEKNTL